MKAQTDFARLTLRLPEDLLTQLKALANDNERSINAEVVSRLSDSLHLNDPLKNPNIQFDRCRVNTDDLAAKIAEKVAHIKAREAHNK